jgi:hypothetical protein
VDGGFAVFVRVGTWVGVWLTAEVDDGGELLARAGVVTGFDTGTDVTCGVDVCIRIGTEPWEVDVHAASISRTSTPQPAR